MVTTDPVPVIASTLSDIEDRRRMATGIKIMATRRDNFTSELEMKLTGVSMVPDARMLMNDALTSAWSNKGRPFITEDTEVIIGGGFAAATYAANRVAAGYPRPVILERASADRVGGTFALSGLTPAWYLNSENRGGMPGQPADGDALNNIPGGILQANMCSAGEYPTNADMAWVIRLSLAQFADVYPDITVTSVSDTNRIRFEYEGVAGTATAGRVLDMRGIGTPRDSDMADGDRVLTFDQFMARQATDFPLMGYNRVAVVGSGDGAKCAVESLFGIGPAASMSVKGLDQVGRVAWYAEGLPRTTEEWRSNNVFDPSERIRTRYMRIGSYLPPENSVSRDVSHDLTIINTRGEINRAGDQVLVNGKAYDHVIMATGYTRDTIKEGFRSDFVRYNGLRVARQTAFAQYQVGVAADLPFQSIERSYQSIDANRVAMFRQGPRIAILASKLGRVGTDPFGFGDD